MTTTTTKTMNVKACTACAAAKRRCGKQTPLCLRCKTRGIDCRYPLAKPTSFVLLAEGDITSSEYSAMPSSDSQWLAYSHATNTGHIGPDLGLDFPELSLLSGGNQQTSWWFSSQETWKFDNFSEVYVSQVARRRMFSSVDLSRILERILGWLARWVDEGSNPFIHQQLYRNRFPRCIQDAYTLLSCYLHKTALNEQAIFQIIEDRVKELVEVGLPLVGSTGGGTNMGSTQLTSLEILGRVQALLVYQCIGLYDGNIRLRYLAEQHIPILTSWMLQLMEHVRQKISDGTFVALSPDEHAATSPSMSNLAPCDNLLWHSWIFVESIRRTSLIANGIQGMYKIIQKVPISCIGGVMFTSRRGFWEAPSAAIWEQRCSEVYAGLTRVPEVDQLLTKVPPEELNEFAKLVFEMAFGVEQMNRWGILDME